MFDEGRCTSCAIVWPFPHLRNLDFHFSVLTDYLGYLFSGQSIFCALTELNFHSSKLSLVDVQNLSKAFKNNKLPALNNLHLSRNVLTNILCELFGDSDHPGFPSLKTLHLSRSELCKSDIIHLQRASQQKKLPKLKKLDLSWNSGCAGHLFGIYDPVFTELKELELMNTDLTKEDLMNVSHGLQSKNLKSLVLNGNNLKGCIKYLLGDEDCLNVSFLESLWLDDCNLGAEDVINLRNSIQSSKFPNMKHIILYLLNLGDMVNEIERLVRTCVDKYKQHFTLSIEGPGTTSTRLRERIQSICNETRVSLSLI